MKMLFAKMIISFKKNLNIVLDFDYTMTNFSSYSSIGVFSNYLDDDYKKKKAKIDKKIQANISNEKVVENYWKKKFLLLKEFVSEKTIKKIVEDNCFIIREEMVDLLKYASKKNVHVSIVSSGCREIIIEVLKKNDIYFDNLVILANEIFSVNDYVITPHNKIKYIDNRFKQYIMFGDSSGDFDLNKKTYNVLYSPFKKNDKKYNKIIIDNNFLPLTCLKNKKCTYGVGRYKDKQIFYKSVSKNIKDELQGYSMVKKYYNVPEILHFDKKNIIYTYEPDLINKTLYEALYVNNNLVININKILMQYSSSLKSIARYNEMKLKNVKFYKKRIKLIDEYIEKETNLNYMNMLIEIRRVIAKKKSLYSFVSQGDPTDTNITVNGKFSDFENGGYNSIVGEMAIFIVSFLTHGRYFYPKYNSNAYEVRPKIIIQNKLQRLNKKILIRYITFFIEKLNVDQIKELNKYLKYYICFRLLTPLNIFLMEPKDRKIILSICDDFLKTKNINEIINLIRRGKYEL